MQALILLALLLIAGLLFVGIGVVMSAATDLQAATAALDQNMDAVGTLIADLRAGQPSPADAQALDAALQSVHSIAGKVAAILAPPGA